MGNRIARVLRRAHDDERGTTLAELVVGMALLAVFMGMFTGAMLLMSKSVNKVEAIGTTSNQVNATFLRLDSSVRYASGISPIAQGATSGDYHVEFDQVLISGEQCVQLRLDGTNLQQRTWTPGSDASTYTNLTTWTTLAANVSAAGNDPFSVPPAVSASASTGYQRLTISLTANSGTSTSATTQNAITFTALNSSTTSTNSVCQQVNVDATS